MKCPNCGMTVVCLLRCEKRIREQWPPEVAERLIALYNEPLMVALGHEEQAAYKRIKAHQEAG